MAVACVLWFAVVWDLQAQRLVHSKINYCPVAKQVSWLAGSASRRTYMVLYKDMYIKLYLPLDKTHGVDLHPLLFLFFSTFIRNSDGRCY